jgi:ABC-2 type transport system permease protein
LQVVATINPLTYAVDASRNLSLAMPVGTGVLSALATSALLCAIAIAFAIKGFRRPL